MQTTSVTDRADWRDFCAAATADLTLLNEWPQIMCDILGDKEFAWQRYHAIGAELVERFGSLCGMAVLEIGGGFGGQARVLMEKHGVRRYSITDLPEAEALQHAYLARHGLRLSPRARAHDLAISCYAMSECARPIQIDYARTMAKVARGYIRWNGWTTGAVRLKTIRQSLPDCTQMLASDDHKRNRIFAWDKTRA